MKTDKQVLGMLAESYAFIGNSLLKPMNQTSDAGLDPQFWDAFAQFDSVAVADAASALREFAAAYDNHEQAAEDVSVEFTRLFIGPPRPEAVPWESYYSLDEDVHSGFGIATFKIQRLLAQVGLEVSNENNQLADHMGIELLLLSVLCERAADGQGDGEGIDIDVYITEHPFSWIDSLRMKVIAVAPDGYFARLLSLAQALLRYQLEG